MAEGVEYGFAMRTMLDLIWGEGYMSPGGEGNIANLVRDLEVRDQRILDIGSGQGSPACFLAETYGAFVVGIDIEPQPNGGFSAEVEWAVTQEGAATVLDVLYRRLSVAYYEPGLRESAVEPVADLLSELLGWDARRRDEEVSSARTRLREDLEFSRGAA